MTEMFGEAWPPMSVPDLAPDDDDTMPEDDRDGRLNTLLYASPEMMYGVHLYFYYARYSVRSASNLRLCQKRPEMV